MATVEMHQNPLEYETHHLRSPLESYVHSLWYPFLTARTRNSHGIVLDLGCGTGIYSRQLTKADTTIAVDLSMPMLEYTKTVDPDAHYIQADAENLPIKDDVVDTTVAIGILDYTRYQNSMLEIQRTLKQGGGLHIVVPNLNNLFYKMENIYDRLIHRRNPKRKYSLRGLEMIMEYARLDIMEVWSAGNVTYAPQIIQRMLLPLWRMLDKIWKPAQGRFPMGLSIYLRCVK